MRLNLPIFDQLQDAQTILIAGAGGGFDVFAGLPIYFTLREMGKTVHLANFSFSPLEIVSTYCPSITLEYGLLVGSQGKVGMELPYYPEGFLTQWFEETRGEDIPIWMFGRTGAKSLAELYDRLLEHLGTIDVLILIDGGVDSLSRGDETGAGTFLEDSITLAAVEHLDIPVKILACLGFGAELEVCHYNALDNIAALMTANAFYGSCALTKNMDVYQHYEQACRYVWDQRFHSRSHINMRVISAVDGNFGDHHLYHDYQKLEVFVSPLMSLYWFFDANAVTERSLIIEHIRDTVKIEDAFAISIRLRERLQSSARPHRKIPY